MRSTPTNLAVLALMLAGAGVGCRQSRRDDPGASPPPPAATPVAAAGQPQADKPPLRPFESPPQPEAPPAEPEGPPTYGPAALTMLGEDDRSTLLAGEADDPIAVDTHYIQSNETRHDLFFGHIDGIGGAYVGVGSDQNYTLMAKAHSQYAFLLDIDDRVVDLHRLYEAFIVESESPEQLMVWWQDDHADATIDFIRERFADDPRLRFLVSGYRSGRETVHRHLLRVLERTVEDKPVSWLSDPELYAHTRALFQTRRVRIMVGNLAGPKTMKTVAAAVEALGTEVRVYYPSNAEDYFRYDRNYRQNVRGVSGGGQQRGRANDLPQGVGARRSLGLPGAAADRLAGATRGGQKPIPQVDVAPSRRRGRRATRHRRDRAKPGRIPPRRCGPQRKVEIANPSSFAPWELIPRPVSGNSGPGWGWTG